MGKRIVERSGGDGRLGGSTLNGEVRHEGKFDAHRQKELARKRKDRFQPTQGTHKTISAKKQEKCCGTGEPRGERSKGNHLTPVYCRVVTMKRAGFGGKWRGSGGLKTKRYGLVRGGRFRCTAGKNKKGGGLKQA